MKHPAQTHIHACRHDRPLPVIGVEAIIIQVLMSTESAIQKKTKLQRPHSRHEGSLGLEAAVYYERLHYVRTPE
jgi:hypothetical protein